MTSTLKPPFELYREMDIADANGHILTAENPEIAKAIFAALTKATDGAIAAQTRADDLLACYRSGQMSEAQWQEHIAAGEVKP